MYQLVKYKELNELRRLVTAADFNNPTEETKKAYWMIHDMLYPENKTAAEEESPENDRILVKREVLRNVRRLAFESRLDVSLKNMPLDAVGKIEEIEWLIYGIQNP